MKLSTRLLLPLLATVVAVMGAYGVWALFQRETSIRAEAERETAAYARALGLAVERALRSDDPNEILAIVDRVDREPAIYGVLVYDADGRLLRASEVGEPLPRATDSVIDEVLRSGLTSTLSRATGDPPAVSVVRPLLAEDGGRLGALEVVQPLASVAAEEARIRQRFLLNTLTLVASVTLVVTWLVRRNVSLPLDRFVQAVRTLGRGELHHRLESSAAAGELAVVAHELNRMADRLEAARSQLLREGEERLELERRLRQSETMAEVGSLAAGLAHEIGAPLQVIRGRASLLLRREPEPEDRERNLRIVVEQIDRISHIVRNLLGYARRRELRPAPFDLAAVSAGVGEFLEDEAVRTGTALIVRGPEGPVPLTGDADLVHQVLLNVALNALHAVESKEGERRVRLVARRLHPREDGAPGGVVEVDDTGPGIPVELRDRVFDPFFTTKGGRQGTGLGLAVARGIATDHGGSIQVVDAPTDDDGRWSTRVRVTLPQSVPGARTPGDPDG
jgi:signal transduction histidine kinase